MAYRLKVTFTDKFEVLLDETYNQQWQAERAASNYIRDYSDPCGTGHRPAYISIIDTEAERVAA